MKLFKHPSDVNLNSNASFTFKIKVMSLEVGHNLLLMFSKHYYFLHHFQT